MPRWRRDWATKVRGTDTTCPSGNIETMRDTVPLRAVDGITVIERPPGEVRHDRPHHSVDRAPPADGAIAHALHVVARARQYETAAEVLADHLAVGAKELFQPVKAGARLVRAVERGLEFLERELPAGEQNLVLAPHVVVERGLRHTELVRHIFECRELEPLGVEYARSGLQYLEPPLIEFLARTGAAPRPPTLSFGRNLRSRSAT